MNVLARRILCFRSKNCVKLVANRGFKSQYSIDKIYPESTLDITKHKKWVTVHEPHSYGRTQRVVLSPWQGYMKPIKTSSDKFSGYIPLDKVQFTYSRSSGPGGQNVNKVNSKVELRFHLASAEWLSPSTRESLAKLHQNYLNKDGFMVLKSDKTRLQTLNQADVLDKLRCYIREAEKPPPTVLPETLALIKKRQERAAAERLREKRHQSELRKMKTVTSSDMSV